MNAKDITLEDLGFHIKKNLDYCICYCRDENEFIWFYKDLHMLEITFEINMQELEAVYNKCKEIGWLNE